MHRREPPLLSSIGHRALRVVMRPSDGASRLCLARSLLGQLVVGRPLIVGSSGVNHSLLGIDDELRRGCCFLWLEFVLHIDHLNTASEYIILKSRTI